MKTKPTVAIWLDNRRARKNGKYPLKIRIIHKRIPYYYPTNITLSEQEFKLALSPKPGNKLKDEHLKLYQLERQAIAAIDKIRDELNLEFSIKLFEKQLQLGEPNYDDVFKCFERKAEHLQKQLQIKTAVGYTTALNAFKEYCGNIHLSFPEVDKRFLEGFESFMLGKKKSLTTVGIYVRCLRTIYNEAIEDKVVSYELYPFGKNKYQVPQSANNKRALDEGDLQKLFQYQPIENSWEEYARDFWMFSMLCQGMNMKDIANLRYKNIHGDKIVFIREKTSRTRKSDQTPIIVYMGKEALDIIQKWGNKNTSGNQFVFPIYSDDNNALQNLRAVEQQIKMINKYMRKIAAELKIKQDFTFYAARHSFATTLKRQGRSTEEIKEFLGHSNIKTTQLYLASFGDDHKRDIMRNFVMGLKKPLELEVGIISGS